VIWLNGLRGSGFKFPYPCRSTFKHRKEIKTEEEREGRRDRQI